MNDDLLVKYLVGEAGAEECRQVEDWIKAAPANRQYYDHFRLIWEESRQLAEGSTADENAAWERFREKVVRTQAKRRPLARLNRYPLRLAAAIALFLTAGWLIWWAVREQQDITPISLASEQHVLNDTLSDGSLITLNKRSVLTYTPGFRGKNRMVTLEGEAFFDIARNPQKPFIIHVADATVEVLGTSFNVRNRDRKTQVIVESGLVNVTYFDQSVQLSAGEKVTISHQDNTIVRGRNRDQVYRYYRKEFIWNDDPLSLLIDKLNEAYDADIVIGDPALEQEKITVTFKNESLDTILNVISDTYNMTIERQGKQIILK